MDRWYPTIIGFCSFWVMVGVHALLGHSTSLNTTLLFGLLAIAVGLIVYAWQRRRQHHEPRSRNQA